MRRSRETDRGEIAMSRIHRLSLLAACASVTIAGAAYSQPASSTNADQRAAQAVSRMTLDEKLRLVFGYFASDWTGGYKVPPEARYGSAGFVPGIPRLGIPPQWETDAGVGVATQGAAKQKRERTALPSGLATAATWK